MPIFLRKEFSQHACSLESVLVVFPQVGIESLAVVAFGLLNPTLFLVEHAELMVGRCRQTPVVKRLEDINSPKVAAFGFPVMPVLLSNHTEPVMSIAQLGPCATPSEDACSTPVGALRLIKTLEMPPELANLYIGTSDFQLVIQTFKDFKRAPVVAFGLIGIASQKPKSAQLAIGFRDTSLIA